MQNISFLLPSSVNKFINALNALARGNVSSMATFASVNSEKFAFDTQSVLPPQSQNASPGGDSEENMNSSTLH